MEENVKVSETYKKAYNQADMICTHMPHLLKGMVIPDNEPSEYTKGFQDRIAQYEKEHNISKNITMSEIRKTYGKNLEKDKNKNLDKN